MAKVIISKTNNLVTVQTPNKFVNYETGVLQASAGTSGGRITLIDTDTSQKVLNNFDITQLVDSTDTVFGATVSAAVTALNAVVNAAPDTLIKSTDKVTDLDGVTASDFTGKSGYAVIVDGTDLNLSTSGKLLFNNHSELKLDADLDLSMNKIYTTAFNSDIILDPNGTGDVKLGNYTLDGDQSVGAGQDNYVLTYDHSAAKIGLEAAPSGGANTNLGNANLTADDDRTYDVDGNSLIFDVNNGDFQIQDIANSDVYLQAANNELILADTLMPIKARGIFRAEAGIEQDEAGLSLAGAYGDGADITFLGSSATSVITGRIYYYSGATWVLYTTANEPPQKALLGVALGTSMGKGFLLRGFINPNGTTNLTAGETVFGSTNASVSSTAPTSGYQRVMGHAISSSVIYFNPSAEYIDLT